MLQLPKGNAICYCGYRHGHSPDSRCYPRLEQIREDLHILCKYWQLLRLYDCSVQAERVLQVIEEDRLPLPVMLGAYLGPEMNNFGGPRGGTSSEEHLKASRSENAAELQRYPDIVFSVAVGSETTVDWTRQAGLPRFVFEAFDESWKGWSDPLEAETHWGLFTVDRCPKLVMRELDPELALSEPA